MAKRKADVEDLQEEKKRQKVEQPAEPKEREITHLRDKKIVYLNKDKSSWVLTWKLEPEARLSPEEFEELWNSHPPEQSIIRLYGKDVKTPRWTQCFGKTYFYSGVTHKEILFTPIVQKYLDYSNTIRNCDFNMCVANWYENGLHYIGAHADDEPQIIKDAQGNTKILSISFGQERDFWLTPKDGVETEEQFQKKFTLGDGDVLMMCGKTQETHKHKIPKVDGTKGKNMDRRVSLTFRTFR